MSAKCRVDGCSKTARTGSLCGPHYQREKAYGDPLHMHEKVCSVCSQGFRVFHKSTSVCSEECKRERERAQYLARDLAHGLSCASCAKPMVASRTSASQGKARCSECRNGGRGYYEYGGGRRASHGQPAYARGCRCDVCRSAASEYMARWNESYAAANGEAYSSTWRRKFKAEHGFWPQGSGFDFVDIPTRRAIYERDGWTCQLCDGPVDPDAAEHADRASLDHVVPQSRGGSHDPSNLRMAHVGCNARRRDRVDDLEGVT